MLVIFRLQFFKIGLKKIFTLALMILFSIFHIRHTMPFPWAGLSLTNHGLTIAAKLSPKPWLAQLVQWEGSWRHINTMENPGFAARSYCGHSLKSSLTHQITVNTLDDQALATKGLHMLLGTISHEMSLITIFGHKH